MNITLYGISNCDTVKRARAWLEANGVGHQFHDYKKSGVPVQRLEAWIGTLSSERLVNRSGTTWRKLDDATRTSAGEAAGAKTLMLALPSVIRRPVVEWGDGSVTVGFDAGEWQERVRRGS